MPHSLWNRLYHKIKISRLKRENFKGAAKITIDDLFQKIDALEKKKETVGESINPEAIEEFKKLKDSRDDLQNKYDKLDGSSSDSWEEVKNAFTQSAKILSKTIVYIAKKLS